MVSSGQLVDEVARLIAYPRNAVLYPYRVLRENGAVTKGGRGRSAANVTPRDAASLLIALAGASQIKDTFAAWQDYSGLCVQKAQGGFPKGDRKPEWTAPALPHLAALPAGHSFLDALTALIESAADGSLAALVGARDGREILGGGVSVDVHGPWPQAHIRVFCSDPQDSWAEALSYHEPIEDLTEWSKDMQSRGYGRLHEHRYFNEDIVFAIADLISS
ncbi:hypothetical protein [Roseospira visakhapatnamensis]|uniref:Uncharacterized protein n=1 Tax=Roseospira visakhapatnamensis TaxID=390880 RepID=A0A7W6RA66_9PROT|nr:hypothetical protein [Roseospira visakhapatnamensis]MBB4264791.1 hypothetical protein [Roseospira visakhapatnamensis]